VEETVETTVQPINEDMLLTESTAKELIHSIQELKELLSEMTTAGMVGTNFSRGKSTKPKKKSKSYEYLLRNLKNSRSL